MTKGSGKSRSAKGCPKRQSRRTVEITLRRTSEARGARDAQRRGHRAIHSRGCTSGNTASRLTNRPGSASVGYGLSAAATPSRSAAAYSGSCLAAAAEAGRKFRACDQIGLLIARAPARRAPSPGADGAKRGAGGRTHWNLMHSGAT